MVTFINADGKMSTVSADNPLPVASAGEAPAFTGLTDAQLRDTPVPVSGTVTATGPLTDAQLRAAAVPISGTVTATGPLTNAQFTAALSGAAYTDVTGAATGSIGSLLKGIFVQLAEINAKTPEPEPEPE